MSCETTDKLPASVMGNIRRAMANRKRGRELQKARDRRQRRVDPHDENLPRSVRGVNKMNEFG